MNNPVHCLKGIMNVKIVETMYFFIPFIFIMFESLKMLYSLSLKMMYGLSDKNQMLSFRQDIKIKLKIQFTRNTVFSEFGAIYFEQITDIHAYFFF